jgi:hypothetical protein
MAFDATAWKRKRFAPRAAVFVHLDGVTDLDMTLLATESDAENFAPDPAALSGGGVETVVAELQAAAHTPARYVATLAVVGAEMAGVAVVCSWVLLQVELELR